MAEEEEVVLLLLVLFTPLNKVGAVLYSEAVAKLAVVKLAGCNIIMPEWSHQEMVSRVNCGQNSKFVVLLPSGRQVSQQMYEVHVEMSGFLSNSQTTLSSENRLLAPLLTLLLAISDVVLRFVPLLLPIKPCTANRRLLFLLPHNRALERFWGKAEVNGLLVILDRFEEEEV